MNHMSIIHEGKKDHRCETCGKWFGFESHLNNHIHSVHENVRFQCDTCGKSYFAKSHLKNHVKRVHESQKICKRCEKPFMVEKLKLHISECPSRCKICGKSFSGPKSQKILRQHVRIVHEGHKPHKCETCGKSFGSSSDMKRHVDSVHLKIPNVWKRRSKSKTKEPIQLIIQSK